MIQVHVVIRRINPALKVDFVQVGYIKDGQFESLHLDALERTPVFDHVEYSNISTSPYINHCQIPSLVEALIAYPDFSIDFFDNTLVLMFSTDLTHNESASKEEGKGH
nr:MAG TPA: hypothetical protein [Microviridae sp.]